MWGQQPAAAAAALKGGAGSDHALSVARLHRASARAHSSRARSGSTLFAPRRRACSPRAPRGLIWQCVRVAAQIALADRHRQPAAASSRRRRRRHEPPLEPSACASPLAAIMPDGTAVVPRPGGAARGGSSLAVVAAARRHPRLTLSLGIWVVGLILGLTARGTQITPAQTEAFQAHVKEVRLSEQPAEGL